MGKQINYWMDYESFLELSKTAVELGCLILKSDPVTGKLVRPDSVVAVYEKLVRKVKKLCPYTEVLDVRFGKAWLHKESISPSCLQLREQEGYILKN